MNYILEIKTPLYGNYNRYYRNRAEIEEEIISFFKEEILEIKDLSEKDIEEIIKQFDSTIEEEKSFCLYDKNDQGYISISETDLTEEEFELELESELLDLY